MFHCNVNIIWMPVTYQDALNCSWNGLKSVRKKGITVIECLLDSQNKALSFVIFPSVDKLGNADRKHNLSATMFPSLPRVKNHSWPKKCISTFFSVMLLINFFHRFHYSLGVGRRCISYILIAFLLLLVVSNQNTYE